MKNKIEEDDFDFGFTFADDMAEELQTTTSELERHQNKAQEIVDMILPLLNNLKKNPDKPNIVWPTREKDIDKFIKKMYDKLNS
jgi:hypothetical protein